MKKLWCGTISVILVVVMLINMLPLNALAVDNNSTVTVSEMPVMQETVLDTIPSADSTEIEQIDEALPAYVVEEDISKRSEFFKEFILSNGLRLATIYPDAVHFEDNGQWKEIDNTLTAEIIDGQNVYTNTSGLWDVRFPQRLSDSNSISITKDGFTVSFGMAGEMRSSGDIVVASMGNELETNASTILPIIGGTIDSIAQIQPIDTTTAKAEAEYAEIIPDKLHSRLLYPSVYNNTNIVYDLQSNQVKESIILQSFDLGLMGYRYILNTGGLIPVLNDDQSINLCDPGTDDIVMTMPAPFMLDANDEYCEDITVSLVQRDNSYILSYHLPVEWLGAEDRTWPVVLDPVVSADNVSNNIQDITVAENGVESNNEPRVKCGYHPTLGICRFYLRFKTLPTLPSSRVIVKANITLTKNTSSSLSAPIEVHKVDDPWEASQTNWNNKPDFQYNIEDVVTVGDGGEYTWEITDIAFGWYSDTETPLSNNTGMLFKAANAVETAQVNNWQQLCSSDHTLTRPVLTITYIDTNGLEEYWDASSNSAGRAGTGYIQPYSGNLTWVHNDIGFDGNLMPVSISHIYNSSDALAEMNLFGMGIGWRTNYNQRIIDPKDGTYIWEDGDGTPHTFVASSNQWKDTDNLGLILTSVPDPSDSENTIYTITDKYGNTSVFASRGHLTAQINNQAKKSEITIEYTDAPTQRISVIEDGVGRKYKFEYNSNGLLQRIDYYGSNEISETSEVNENSIFTSIYYEYTGSTLTSITYADDVQSLYSYTLNNLLSSATDCDGYKITYGYNTLDTGKPRRVVSVSESDGGQIGGSLTLEYAYNRTTLTDYKGDSQTYFFNEYGNTISIQDSEGRATFFQYDTDTDDTTGVKNRIKKASQQQNTVVNLIQNHSFESGTIWTCGPYATCTDTPTKAYIGNRSLQVNCQYGGYTGVTSENYNIAAGSTVTFSAYIFVSSGTISLRIDNGVTYYESDYLSSGNDWVRLEVTYKNSSTSTKQISLTLFFVDKGTAYMDCVQLEKANTASRYNLIEDSDFKHSYAWTALDGSASGANHGYNEPAPTLDHRMIEISNYPNQTMYVQQSVNVKGQAGDTFVFGGWMGGNASANPSAVWALSLVINNTDGTTTEASISPNRNLPGMNVWQYIASSVIAEKAYKSVYFRIDYGYDSNSVHADGLQLFREPFAEEYTYDDEDDDNTNDNGNVILVRDIRGQETKYTYTNNDPTLIEYPGGATLEQEFINHNLTKSVERFMLNGVSTATASHIYSYDAYGNLIKHQAQSGSTIKITKASYSDDHNHLASTTDEMDNVTYYYYDPNESTLLWVQYPEDTSGEEDEYGNDTIDTRTYFEYDSMYRLKNTTATVNQNTSMSAVYAYSGDALTQIQTPSTVYKLDYRDLGLRKSVSVGETPLAIYVYTHGTDIDVIDQDKLLKHLDYGNGDDVKYYYDDLGRITKEIYYDNGSSIASRTVTYTYDNNGALATTADSKTGTTTKFYYDTVGRLDRQVRYVGSHSNTLQYTYDDRGNVVSVKDTQNGSIYTTAYQYDGLNRVTNVASGTSSENYVYDVYGRYDGGYVYHNGNWVLYKSVFYGGKTELETSDQVYIWSCTSASGYKDHYTFGYDGNGNIVSVKKNNYTTQYIYDSQNQLIRENNEEAGKTWVWTYDFAGNITSKKEYAYTTDSLGTVQDAITYSYPTSGAWKDLLTSYDGKTISYDAIGNPLSDGTWTYTWEQGRQLVRMTYGQNAWNFTYDSNGMRTGRINAGTGDTYTYVYNGSQLSRMTYGSNTMWFTYGADGKPLSVKYNGSTYYYVTNLQGDVVAILNSSGTAVVSYTYDAWGKPLTTTGTMANTLGLHNPLRYRGYVYDRETGLYYLQSRYYNPEWGRFINADDPGYMGVDGTLSSYNLFAYCGNNPINNIDPQGKWTISLSIGLDFTAFFFGASVSIGVAFDDNGNVAVQWSYSTPNYLNGGEAYNYGLLDAGAGLSLQITDDDDIYDLEGPGCYAGFSAGDGPYGGVDLVYSGITMMDDRAADALPNGIQLTMGYGWGIDVHFRQTKTSTLWVLH